MFFPLPAHTIIEARIRTRRNTAVLLTALGIIYTVFANLLAWVLILATRPPVWPSLAAVTINATAAAILISIAHYLTARSRTLDRILKEVRAHDAESADEKHRVFINTVAEAEAAVGIRPIRAVIIPNAALNAFSVMDGAGRSAIGITEGLLSKLDRAELSAVIAHEAAHLAHGDSQLIATACSMFSIFDTLDSFMSTGDAPDSGSRSSGFYPTRMRIRGRGAAGYLLVLLVVKTGHFLTRILYMAISRNREHLADADAVHICKDPMSLAEALYKISRADRGGHWMAAGYAAAFIMNPLCTHLDEERGWVANLLSTHPPVSERLEKLLAWAKSDLANLTANVRADAAVSVHEEGQWKAPVTAHELMAGGLVKPTTRVAVNDQIQRAHEIEEFREHFNQELKHQHRPEELSSHACPRCHVLLLNSEYEGVPVQRCVHCRGVLLNKIALDRIVIRKQYRFTDEVIDRTRTWRSLQIGTIKNLCQFPPIVCPRCADGMAKLIHSELTRVVIDRCMNNDCQSIWLDDGEIEKIQILVEEVSRLDR